MMMRGCLLSFLAMVLSWPALAQSLICDEKPFHRDCIDCLVAEAPESRLGLCYSQDLQDGPAFDVSGGNCPARMPDLRDLTASTAIQAQAILVANRRLANSLQAFEDSDNTECELLPDDILEPPASPSAEGIEEAEPGRSSDGFFDLAQGCILQQIESLRAEVRNYPGEKLLLNNLLDLYGLQADLEGNRETLGNARSEEAVLNERVVRYRNICRFG